VVDELEAGSAVREFWQGRDSREDVHVLWPCLNSVASLSSFIMRPCAVKWTLAAFALLPPVIGCAQHADPDLTLREAISVLKAEDSWGDGDFPFVVLEDWPREWIHVEAMDTATSQTLDGAMGKRRTIESAVNPDAPTRTINLEDHSLTRRQVIEGLAAALDEYETPSYTADSLVIVNRALASDPRWPLNKPLPADFEHPLTCSEVLLILFRQGGMFQDLRGEGVTLYCPSGSFESTAWTPEDRQTGTMRDAVVALMRRTDPGREYWYMVKLLPEVETDHAAEDLAERPALEWVILRQGKGLNHTNGVVAEREAVRRSVRNGEPLGYTRPKWVPREPSLITKTPTPVPTPAPAP
jgi:hypothetical protein